MALAHMQWKEVKFNNNNKSKSNFFFKFDRILEVFLISIENAEIQILSMIKQRSNIQRTKILVFAQ